MAPTASSMVLVLDGDDCTADSHTGLHGRLAHWAWRVSCADLDDLERVDPLLLPLPLLLLQLLLLARSPKTAFRVSSSIDLSSSLLYLLCATSHRSFSPGILISANFAAISTHVITSSCTLFMQRPLPPTLNTAQSKRLTATTVV